MVPLVSPDGLSHTLLRLDEQYESNGLLYFTFGLLATHALLAFASLVRHITCCIIVVRRDTLSSSSDRPFARLEGSTTDSV
jgi:hypothetical protein